MKMFELLPKPLGDIFRKLTHFTCNSPKRNWRFPDFSIAGGGGQNPRRDAETMRESSA